MVLGVEGSAEVGVDVVIENVARWLGICVPQCVEQVYHEIIRIFKYSGVNGNSTHNVMGNYFKNLECCVHGFEDFRIILKVGIKTPELHNNYILTILFASRYAGTVLTRVQSSLSPSTAWQLTSWEVKASLSR